MRAKLSLLVVKRKKIESDSEETEIDSDTESSRRKGPPNKKTSKFSILSAWCHFVVVNVSLASNMAWNLARQTR